MIWIGTLTISPGMFLLSNIIKFYLLTKVCRDSQQCAEDFRKLMEITGWSQTTLYIAFFTALFFILLLIVFVLYKLQKHKVRPYRYKNRKKPFRKYRR